MRTQPFQYLSKGLAVAIGLYLGLQLLLSLWQWPLYYQLMDAYLATPSTTVVAIATVALLVLNALWLGIGFYLAWGLWQGRRGSPWIYYLCATSLLFGPVPSKVLAVMAMTLRLVQDALGDAVE
ncbi:hypothetical protein [Ferrimonas marina]|uniref:hypothetical protein n=1 Tax=Ferrimonas marina TaxID=299255 RepID=UPI000832BC82|nr:hypothetical protein [Ferrimonas marina]